MNRLRDACRKFADSFPCLIALLAVLNADLPTLITPGLSANTCALAPLPLTLAVWFLLGSARTLRMWMFPTLLLLFSLHLAGRPEPRLPERTAGVELRVLMTDPSLCGGTPSWLPNAPFYTLAEAMEFRYTPSDTWQTASGKLFLRLPRTSGVAPGYGDVCRVTGTLEPVVNSGAPGAFDLATYARYKGADRILTVRETELLQRGSPLLRRLYDLRGTVLEAFGKPLGAQNRAAAAALLFGMKQGIDAETKADFLQSGTIHVLCVSGLHIALFAGIVLLLLRPFPFTMRWIPALIPVLLYALSTGMQGPAVRAFVMFAVWALLKTFHCRTRPMNTIALAAVLLILWNPLSPLDSGFQYSFLCVAFLLICGDWLNGIRSAAFSRWKYRFRDPGALRRTAADLLIFSLGASAAAWLASFGVSMLRQGLFSPFAVPAYLLMSPAAWLCFAIFVFGLCFCWIPGVPELCGLLMAPMLSLLRAISSFFADAGFLYTRPSPWWGILIYLILLAAFFRSRTRRMELALAILLVLVSAVFLLSPLALRPELLIRHGGGVRPMLILSDPAVRRALVINMPDYGAARDAASYLHSRGITAAEELFCDSARRDSCGGATAFLNLFTVRGLHFAAPVRINALYARRAQKRAAEQGLPAEPLPSASAEYRKTADGFLLRLLPPWNGLLLRFRETPMQGGSLEIHRNGQLLQTIALPPEREIQYDTLTLPEYAGAPAQAHGPSGKIQDRKNDSCPRSTPKNPPRKGNSRQ